MTEDEQPAPGAQAALYATCRPGARAIPPGLHLIATPIGTARDITLRALDILAGADVLAAEDTRSLRHLMDIHGIAVGGRPLIAYHDHNADTARPAILRALAAGKSVAYASEAGTPLVADPGYQLVRAAIAGEVPVLAAPGPSAVLAALTVAGMPTDRFLFAGFPPSQAGARQAWIQEIATVPATVVIYDSPKRVGKILGELVKECGEDRQAAVCRELTKRFEEVRRDSLGNLARHFDGLSVKGEIVIVLDKPAARRAEPADVEAALRQGLQTGRLRDVAGDVARAFGLPRRDVYQLGLRIGGDGE